MHQSHIESPDPAAIVPALTILGAPGVLTDWVFALVQRLLAERGIAAIVSDRADEPSPAWHGGVVLAHYPGRALRDLLLAGEGACVLIVDDPHDMVFYASGGNGAALPIALRSVSASLSCLASIRRAHPRAIRLVRNRAPENAAELVTAFRHALGCGSGPEEASAAAHARSLEQALAESSPAYVPPGAGRELLGEAGAHVVDLVVAPLVHLIGSGSLPAVTWPHDCFFLGDEPGTPVSTAVDLTGSARIVFYGPYFHLPAGRYTGEVILGFSPDGLGLPLTIEFASERQLGRGRVRSMAPGVFAAAVPFEVEAPENGIEVRISNDRGAIEGRIALHRVVIREESLSEVGQDAGREIDAITPPS